jgi:hypothetical protein
VGSQESDSTRGVFFLPRVLAFKNLLRGYAMSRKENSKHNATGPRTSRGKARSSQNAAKHWIQSTRILPEEQKDAALLRSGFEEDFKPQGLSEQEIVDDLVFNRLHKRRIDIVFTREYSKATIEKTIELTNERPLDQHLGNLMSGHSAEPAERPHPEVIVYVLEDLVKGIGGVGSKAQHLTLLRGIYGDKPPFNIALAVKLLTEYQEVQSESRRQVLQTLILDALRAEIPIQKFQQMLARDHLAVELPREFREPPRDVLDTLLRYRAANTREFNSLLDGLERVRRLRQNAT